VASSCHYGYNMSETARGTAQTLTSLLDIGNTYLGQRLDGLTDEEWLWEPVPGCWTLRDGTMDFAIPEPAPSPVTTIAWRLHHIQACNEVELSWIRDEPVPWEDVQVPSSADEGVGLWARSANALRDAVDAMSDVDLEIATATVAGYEPIRALGLPRIYFATTLVRENIHHGAEIGVLRDLYRNR
jgi:hypothetical protein